MYRKSRSKTPNVEQLEHWLKQEGRFFVNSANIEIGFNQNLAAAEHKGFRRGLLIGISIGWAIGSVIMSILIVF